ncbi:HU family DNA-binding protein [uncultured Roseobacter sp.]|uniref:HU family DNA-binding protein n=1 Tax=uncultured Roseobacter sp. TaxID=114847 RepID=UPI0026389C71|nr:HU family DNA-binding protein [uncultured Roseobacter sp.]
MSTSKTTPRKTGTRAKPVTQKSAAKPAAPTKKASEKTAASKNAAKAADFPNALRKKELVEKVVARTGVKKRDAKPVVEALLAELGETLAEGRSLVLPPLGRVRINREKKLSNGRVIVAKIRQTNPPLKAALEPSSDGAKD